MVRLNSSVTVLVSANLCCLHTNNNLFPLLTGDDMVCQNVRMSTQGGIVGEMAKKNIFSFYQMKEKGEKITYLTAYDFPTSSMSSPATSAMRAVGKSYAVK